MSSSEKNYLRDSRKFLSKALRPDKQKLVLPLVMSLLLVAGAVSTVQLQESYGEKSLNITVETITDLQVLNARNKSFPESINGSVKSIEKNITESADTRKNKLKSSSSLETRGLLSLVVFRSKVFPVVPDKTLAPWGSEEDYVRAVSLTRYRSAKIQSLTEKANKSVNYSYIDFQRDIERVKSKKWDSREVQSFLENQNSSTGAVGIMGQLSYQKVKADGVKELSLASFLPSVFATLILYYVLGALAVQTNREFNQKVIGKSE